MSGPAAHPLGGRRRGLTAGLHHARDRGAGQQQHGGQHQEDEEDVRARLGKQLGRDPEERLSDQPAVFAQVGGIEEAVARSVAGAEPERPGGEPERERAHQACRARLEGVQRRHHGPDHEQRPDCEQRHRRQVADRAEQEEDAVGHGLPHPAACPAEVEHAREEGRECDEREPDQVPVALLELWQLRASARDRGSGVACGGELQPSPGHSTVVARTLPTMRLHERTSTGARCRG